MSGPVPEADAPDSGAPDSGAPDSNAPDSNAPDSNATGFNVAVEVSLRDGIADPEGLTIERALPALGFGGVSGVRVGKSLRFVVEAASEAEARQQVEAMCERFLANPVIEDTVISITPAERG